MEHPKVLLFNYQLPGQNGIWAKSYNFVPKNDEGKSGLEKIFLKFLLAFFVEGFQKNLWDMNISTVKETLINKFQPYSIFTG